MPAPLLESELFGHERGAFTDARAAKPGLFEVAQGGTLFLDEVHHLALDLQAKLLRALEHKSVRRLGATTSRTFDVRIVAASNAALGEEVRTGRFREDLYYRLNVITINVPPLRERREDVRLLLEQPLVGVNPTPADGHREDTCGLGSANVEGRVADVRGVRWSGAELLDRGEHRIRVRLVPLRVLVGDYDVELLGERREALERERDRTVPLCRDDPEPPALRPQPRENLEHLLERLERVMERIVVRSVDLDQLVGAVRVELPHLRNEALASDRGRQLLVGDLPIEHGANGVLHRREDDRPRVDQRAVEVEEADGETHSSIVVSAQYATEAR